MKKLIISLIIALGATSCGTTSLYYWGYQTQGTSAYEHLSYKRSDKESPKTICKVVEMYEHLLANPGGLRQVPPPGICAEYAYMLLQPELVDIFFKNATNSQLQSFNDSQYGNDPAVKAVKLLEQEIALYPESTLFITPLLNRFKNQ